MLSNLRITLLITCFIPVSAMAGTCDDLAHQAAAVDGKWQAAVELPPASAAEDGLWYAPQTRAAMGIETSEFQPHHQADRDRLIAEAQQNDKANWQLAAAYLSPSAVDFDAIIGPLADAADVGYAAVRTHRWSGVNVFAVSLHDGNWYDCQRATSLFYSDEAGILRETGAAGLSDCDAPHSRSTGPRPVMIDGQLGFVDENDADDALPSQADMQQTIVLWRRDHLSSPCAVSYYHNIAYYVSDDTRPQDAHQQPRPVTDMDAWLTREFNSLIPLYIQTTETEDAVWPLPAAQWSAALRTKQIAIFDVFSQGSNGRSDTLLKAYDLLAGRGEIETHSIIEPIVVNDALYLIQFAQRSDGSAVPLPYVDIVMFDVAGDASHRVANITLDHVREGLRAVEVKSSPE